MGKARQLEPPQPPSAEVQVPRTTLEHLVAYLARACDLFRDHFGATDHAGEQLLAAMRAALAAPTGGALREEPFLVVEYSTNPEDPRLPVQRALVPLRAYLAYNSNMAEAFTVVTGFPARFVVDYDDLDWYTRTGEPWYPTPNPATNQYIRK